MAKLKRLTGGRGSFAAVVGLSLAVGAGAVTQAAIGAAPPTAAPTEVGVKWTPTNYSDAAAARRYKALLKKCGTTVETVVAQPIDGESFNHRRTRNGFSLLVTEQDGHQVFSWTIPKNHRLCGIQNHSRGRQFLYPKPTSVTGRKGTYYDPNTSGPRVVSQLGVITANNKTEPKRR